jgi:hypothetical protein
MKNEYRIEGPWKGGLVILPRPRVVTGSRMRSRGGKYQA